MGQLIRLLLVFAAVWLAIQLVRRALRPDRSPGAGADGTTPARMLPCAYCGVHVPESEAIFKGDKAYCSREHRALEETTR